MQLYLPFLDPDSEHVEEDVAHEDDGAKVQVCVETCVNRFHLFRTLVERFGLHMRVCITYRLFRQI